jgi:endonuclease/exonuclease/phosphatase family metal-dependent hydrolase
MKGFFVIALAGLLFLGVFSTPAAADSDVIRVMTRNQYLGADLTPVIAAETPGEFMAAAADALEQIAFNNFPLRARRLAAEVALTKPDLIGLQEVFDFTVDGANIGPPFVDHLTDTLDALAARGQNYVMAAEVKNLDITIPFDVYGDPALEYVRVVDRDVILVREGVDFTPLTGDFTTGGLCGVSIPNPAYDPEGPFPEKLQSMPSEEGNGCNYTVVLQVPSPTGTVITVHRGFVGVDVTVRGKDYRFVNTHLEQNLPIPNPNSAIYQFLQSYELVGTLQATAPFMSPDRTLILVGDFNSSPEHEPIGPIVPPYQVIVGSGFADVWDTNPLKLFDRDGFTCCQDDDLANTMSLLDERIDLIFVRDASFRPLAFVTGRVPIFPLRRPPNWASDHSGVFGKLIFRRGAMD